MKPQRGFTLLELVVTATVLMILASVVVPLAKNGLRRQSELELRRSLREMRTAIDTYKKAAEQMKIKPPRRMPTSTPRAWRSWWTACPSAAP